MSWVTASAIGSAGTAWGPGWPAWAVAGFLISFMIPHVNNAGHIGGFVGGLLLGSVFPAQRSAASRAEQVLALLLVIATVVGFGLSVWKMWTPYTTGLGICS